MDTQNHFYGHSTVLARYAGLRRPRHLAGLLQHGWTALSPLEVNFGDFPRVGAEGDARRLLVWSHASRAWDPQTQDRPSTAIGAPWLYLARMLRPTLPPHDPAASPLVIPMHGTHVARLDADPAAMARFYRDSLGPATICLHVEDLGHRDLVAAWSLPGNEIVSAGSRFDPLFLVRLLTGMAAAGRVVSNRLQTAVWYAIAIGVPASVHGPVPRIRGESEAALERLRATWPEVHGEEVPLARSAPLADDELGARYLRPAEQVRALAGWAPPVSPRAFADYWAAAPVDKALRVLGVRERVAVSAPERSGVVAAPRPVDFLRHPLSHLPRHLPWRGWDGRAVDWVRPAP
ncbi:MAG: hypothetical protein IPO89_04910 [Actinomycetales bacterium]|nr:hypothetical protein [Candidatus Lutibacillus vidarii]